MLSSTKTCWVHTCRKGTMLLQIASCRMQVQNSTILKSKFFKMVNQNASVVITHHIADGKQDEYEKWLDVIGPVARKSKGNIDWQIIRPIPKLTFNYTVIIRF